MTPTQQDLYDRAQDLREVYDELGETEGLSNLDTRVVRLLEDLIDELESA